jgi:hypothetical protein
VVTLQKPVAVSGVKLANPIVVFIGDDTKNQTIVIPLISPANATFQTFTISGINTAYATATIDGNRIIVDGKKSGVTSLKVTTDDRGWSATSDVFVVDKVKAYDVYTKIDTAMVSKPNDGVKTAIAKFSKIKIMGTVNDEYYFVNVNGKIGFLSKFGQWLDPDDRFYTLINNQNQLSDVHYGTRTMDYNGCELVAIHNAFLLLGKPSSILDIRDTFEKKGAYWVFGELGTDPASITWCFATYNVKYKEVQAPPVAVNWYDYASVLDAQVPVGGVVILSFWNDSLNIPGGMLHTIAAQKIAKDTYKTYNANVSQGSIGDIIGTAGRGVYITGYYVWR